MIKREGEKNIFDNELILNNKQKYKATIGLLLSKLTLMLIRRLTDYLLTLFLSYIHCGKSSCTKKWKK